MAVSLIPDAYSGVWPRRDLWLHHLWFHAGCVSSSHLRCLIILDRWSDDVSPFLDGALTVVRDQFSVWVILEAA